MTDRTVMPAYSQADAHIIMDKLWRSAEIEAVRPLGGFVLVLTMDAEEAEQVARILHFEKLGDDGEPAAASPREQTP